MEKRKFCKYCGAVINAPASSCPHCKKKLTDARQTTGHKTFVFRKNQWYVIGAILFVLVIIAVAWNTLSSSSRHCSICSNKAVNGSKYCYIHKCAVANCNNKLSSGSNYCHTHAELYDEDDDDTSDYTIASQLKISNVKIEHTSRKQYTKATGTIANNSNYTVRYVEIKGAFKDYQGNVIDTDWTYVVGSEGLAPGESCKWSMSVNYDYSIKSCSVSIIDLN